MHGSEESLERDHFFGRSCVDTGCCNLRRLQVFPNLCNNDRLGTKVAFEILNIGFALLSPLSMLIKANKCETERQHFVCGVNEKHLAVRYQVRVLAQCRGVGAVARSYPILSDPISQSTLVTARFRSHEFLTRAFC